MRQTLALLFAMVVSSALAGQLPSLQQTNAKDAKSKQSFFVEELSNTVNFERDGTGSREMHAKFRIFSDAAVQQLGVLVFPYLTANEEIQINDVHVRKPDGTIIKTSADDIQDLPSEVTRVAPLYSDLHEKHVPVKGLGVGDELEYDVRVVVKTAQIPNHFAFEYRRLEEATAEDESLAIRVPAAISVTVKSLDPQPSKQQAGNYVLYRWKWSRPEPVPEDQRSTLDSQPTVQVSNFENWADIARWYWDLQKDRVSVTPTIQAKAEELTKGQTTEADKIRAMYNYVSLKIRYVGIDFGQGRYQPHSADDVLSNQYGDCKDKHTLLAALLSAVGVKSYPILISTTRKLDATVPSVSQFNHVITAVKQGSSLTVLDTTPQVAPYGMLFASLRGKLALLVSDGPGSKLVTTSALPPFESYDHFSIEAKLDSSGVLDGDVKRELRGDTEVLLRLAFRNTPQANWQDLVQKLSYISGFSGEVSNVVVSDPDVTTEPLKISYHYRRKGFGDWDNRRIPAPMPSIGLPSREEMRLKPSEPLRLAAENAEYSSEIALPKGYWGKPPANFHFQNELADFESTFSFRDGVFYATRRLTPKVQEVPKNQYEGYDALRKAVVDDYSSMVEVADSNEGGTPVLPNADEREAAQLMWQAQRAGQQRDIQGAQELLRKVIKLDPKFPKAWVMLGSTYLMSGDPDQGLEDMRKEVSLHPDDLDSYRVLGFSLMSVRRNREAQQVWQDLLKHDPDDWNAAANLGNLLTQDKKYSEALVQYQSAVKNKPDSASLYNGLGVAALHAGNAKMGVDSLDKAVELDPKLANDVAYELAENKQALDKALDFAKRAVAEQEQKSSEFKLDSLELDDLRTVDLLSAYWDTLGWVYFEMGDMQSARRFLNAAWSLSQGPVEADHLGQVYEGLGQPNKAVEMYALALATDGQMPETRERLIKLVSSEAKVNEEIAAARDKASRLRELHIQRKSAEKGSAEFFLLLQRGTNNADVKYIRGDEGLKSFVPEIAASKFDPQFPDDANTKIIRRGILDCTSLGCDFVLIRPSDVHSVE